MSETALLETRGLTRRFGGVAAVDGVDLTVRAGAFHAIIGPNGAGKTTLFNLLTGDIRPSSGSIRYAGREIAGTPPYRLARLGIGRTFQISSVILDATVRENVRLALLARDRRIWDMVAVAERLYHHEAGEISALVGLAEVSDRPARALSYGDRRRLELALALAGNPKLLLLDEPACGMSVSERPGFVALIRDIVARRGMTALLIEHDMDVVFGSAERITVMDRGRILTEGTPEQIENDPHVRRVYLGEFANA